MSAHRTLVAGGSLAGLSAVKELRRRGYDGQIQVIDADVNAPYRRPDVSKGLLTGEVELDDCRMPWSDDLGVNLLRGHEAIALDPGARTVTANGPDGAVTFDFDHLVLATGSVARPSELGRGLTGVFTLRSAADAARLRSALLEAQDVVIVGGGFIGLEVAAVARGLGRDVTVVEFADAVLTRVLGGRLAGRVEALHRDNGVNVRCATSVVSLDGDGAVSGVVLSSGQRLPADLVLICVGSAPAIDWLRSSGLALDDGVLCDHRLRVAGLDGVVAAGDVARWPNSLYGRSMRVEHWTNAMEQGIQAARTLLDGAAATEPWSAVPYFWSDQFGARIQCIGTTLGADASMVVLETPDRMLTVYASQGRIIGAAGFNAGGQLNKYRAKVVAGALIEDETLRDEAG